MNETNIPAALVGDREIVSTRILNAPRDLIFSLWADPEHIGRWWGPKGFTTTTFTMDFKPGGVWRFVMHGPDGRDYQNNVTWPREMLTTTTFAEHEGKTTVTIRWAPINASEQERATFHGGRESMKMGWTGTFEQLAQYLAKV